MSKSERSCVFIILSQYYLYMYCRKKSKKRKSGEIQPVFGVDSKDMRHGK